jgi:hypothetical protein
MDNRIDALIKENHGKEQFCKLCLNGSYGYDGKNTEKYVRSAVKTKSEAFKAQVFDTHVDTRKLSENKYMVVSKPRSFHCDTCLQESYFTLDNAKYWYLNFVYNFMYKCLDMNRMHFIQGDTDSAYWAISGNLKEDYKQGFKYVVKDRKFYDKHIYEWMPDPSKGKYDEKKLLGLAIEKEAENCIALAPKCYTIWNSNETISLRAKGISLKKNKQITSKDYQTAFTKPIRGIDVHFRMKDGVMSQVTIYKNAITATHTKAVVLSNNSCAPFIYGIPATDYSVDGCRSKRKVAQKRKSLLPKHQHCIGCNCKMCNKPNNLLHTKVWEHGRLLRFSKDDPFAYLKPITRPPVRFEY